MTPISVLIPARNDARNLSRCLEALRGWADEVVVVDSESTDDTAAVVGYAKEHVQPNPLLAGGSF